MLSNRVTEFGVTTASGATASYPLISASPIARSGLVARLGSRVISLESDGRGAYVHVFVDCKFLQPLNIGGQPYTFDLQNLRGNGTGVGCAAAQLVGYQALDKGSGFTVTQRTVQLSADGTKATSGTGSTVGVNLSSTDPRVKTAESVSCDSVTMTNGGVREHQ